MGHTATVGEFSDIHVNTVLYVTSSVRGEGKLVSYESAEDEEG